MEKSQKVFALHQSFVDASSHLILTKSFWGTSFRLQLHSSEHRVTELNKACVQLAKQVADGSSRSTVVAGSIGATGGLFLPLAGLERHGVLATFVAQADALVERGADQLWIETMSSFLRKLRPRPPLQNQQDSQ